MTVVSGDGFPAFSRSIRYLKEKPVITKNKNKQRKNKQVYYTVAICFILCFVDSNCLYILLLNLEWFAMDDMLCTHIMD